MPSRPLSCTLTHHDARHQAAECSVCAGYPAYNDHACLETDTAGDMMVQHMDRFELLGSWFRNHLPRSLPVCLGGWFFFSVLNEMGLHTTGNFKSTKVQFRNSVAGVHRLAHTLSVYVHCVCVHCLCMYTVCACTLCVYTVYVYTLSVYTLSVYTLSVCTLCVHCVHCLCTCIIGV